MGSSVVVDRHHYKYDLPVIITGFLFTSVIIVIMIADITITEKSFGPKSLYKNVSFSIADNEKIGVVGRNGVGKSTLLGILSGTDTDFTGDIVWRRGVAVVSSRQEHHGHEQKTVLDYILGDLPEYAKLSHIIETYPETMGDNVRKISEYTEALERFSTLGYYDNEGLIVEDLKRMQIPPEKAHGLLANLSGGQKRLVEVVKIMHSKAHLALIDEPTNHMDYVAKQQFVDWMKSANTAMLIITHDRDVLNEVDRIIEIKDGEAEIYDGNYDQYLALNASRTTSGMHEYAVIQRQITNLTKRIEYAKSKKASWGGTADKRNPFVVMETKARKERDQLLKIEKPSFWIDKDSVDQLGLSAGASYQKFKAKNIRIHGSNTTEGFNRMLVAVKQISLGYKQPLFDDISFELREGEAIELRGRNGAGKTTLIKKILETAGVLSATDSLIHCYAGLIEVDSKVIIGVYEQEVSRSLFDLTLHDAVEKVYLDLKQPIGETKIRQVLADYLFVASDLNVPVSELSGGQKARLQLIKMLAGNPNLLILDEPTNHLDLPSIEELEQALNNYKGAILYVSHDSYFQQSIGGTVIKL